MRDAFPIVCQLGDRLRRDDERAAQRGQRTRPGWRDAKALIVLVAEQGDWNGATALADALGVGPDAQEAIYREVITGQGRATPPEPPRKKEPA